MVLYEINAYGVRFEDTRRSACVGFLLRSFFRFFAQITQFAIQPTDEVGEMAARGPIQDAAQSSNEQVERGRKRRRV